MFNAKKALEKADRLIEIFHPTSPSSYALEAIKNVLRAGIEDNSCECVPGDYFCLLCGNKKVNGTNQMEKHFNSPAEFYQALRRADREAMIKSVIDCKDMISFAKKDLITAINKHYEQ